MAPRPLWRRVGVARLTEALAPVSRPYSSRHDSLEMEHQTIQRLETDPYQSFEISETNARMCLYRMETWEPCFNQPSHFSRWFISPEKCCQSHNTYLSTLPALTTLDPGRVFDRCSSSLCKLAQCGSHSVDPWVRGCPNHPNDTSLVLDASIYLVNSIAGCLPTPSSDDVFHGQVVLVCRIDPPDVLGISYDHGCQLWPRAWLL
jgi:hypothetical protein